MHITSSIVCVPPTPSPQTIDGGLERLRPRTEWQTGTHTADYDFLDRLAEGHDRRVIVGDAIRGHNIGTMVVSSQNIAMRKADGRTCWAGKKNLKVMCGDIHGHGS